MMHLHTYILFCVLDFPIFPLPFALFSSLLLSVSVSLSHSFFLSLSLPPFLPPSHSLSVSLFPSLPPSLYLSLLSSSLSLSLPTSFSLSLLSSLLFFLSLSLLPFPSLLSFRKQIESINTPSPRCSHQAVFFKDKIYVFGGEYATLDQFHHYRYKNLDVYCLP